MKRLFASFVLLLASCATPPALARAPRLMTPRVGDAGACGGSQIQLRKAQLYSDRNNKWSLIAEAANMRVDNFDIVMVCIAIDEKDGTQVREQQLIGAGLRSYETIPFRLLLNTSLDQAERVTIAAQPFPNEPATAPQITMPLRQRNFPYSVISWNGKVNSLMRIVGWLRNNEPQPMMNVRLIIGLYDRAGRLIGVADGMAADIAPIAPGNVVPFTATTNMLLAPIASASVLIEGEPAEAVIGK